MDFSDEDYDGFASLDEDKQDRLVRKALQKAFRKRIDEGGLDMFDEPARSLYDEAKSSRAFNKKAKERYLKRLANRDSPLNGDEVAWLSGVAGRDDDGFSPFDGDDDGVTDDMLEGYAKHLRNYLYTYKDEAKQVDPTIDPEEEHAGPMAQDIEKVAPDCVEETPEGVKTVDGNRLALVNAGVIGELSRRVLELEEKINGRGS